MSRSEGKMFRPKTSDLVLFGVTMLIFAGAVVCLFIVSVEVASLVGLVGSVLGWWSFRGMERDQRKYFREQRRRTAGD